MVENAEADPDPLKKNTFQPLLDVILRNIIKEKKVMFRTSVVVLSTNLPKVIFIIALHFFFFLQFSFYKLSLFLCSFSLQGATSASYRLAASVIQSCTGKLMSCVSQFLTSCILNRDAVGSPVKESYHEIILEIYQVAPELLLSVIPLFTHELLVCYPVTAHSISKVPYHFYLVEFVICCFLSSQFPHCIFLYTQYYYRSCHYNYFCI